MIRNCEMAGLQCCTHLPSGILKMIFPSIMRYDAGNVLTIRSSLAAAFRMGCLDFSEDDGLVVIIVVKPPS